MTKEVDLLTTFECFRLKSPIMTHRTCLINHDMAGKLKKGKPLALGMLHHCLDCKDYAIVKAQHPDWAPYLDDKGKVRYPGLNCVEQEVKERIKEEVKELPCQNCTISYPGQVVKVTKTGNCVECGKFFGLCKEDFILPSSPPVHPCPNHPDREQRVAKNGKRLGVCDECLSTRSSTKNLSCIHGGRSRFVQIYFRDKHLELKKWLDKEAEEEERSIQEQILYTLKKGREAICPK